MHLLNALFQPARSILFQILSCNTEILPRSDGRKSPPNIRAYLYRKGSQEVLYHVSLHLGENARLNPIPCTVKGAAGKT
jgi:hypothetical protein